MTASVSVRRTLFGLSAVLYAFLYAPVIVVIIYSFNSARYGSAWRGFTTEWYRALWHNPAAWNATTITLLLAALSTAASTILGTLLALGLSRGSFAGKKAAEWSLQSLVVVPDIVMAVSLLLFYKVVRDALGIFQPGLLTMTLAHITLEIPFVALVVRARLAGLDPALSEASRDLGATGCQTFRHVTLPLIWPGILAGGMLAFTLSLDDFVVSFFTTGPGATTLPILIYSSVKRGITPEINALSTLLVMASVVATTAIMALQNRRDNSSAEHSQG